MTAATRSRMVAGCIICIVSVVAALLRSASAQEQRTDGPAHQEHELLKKDVGTWDAIVTVSPSEGAEAMESKGTETNELLTGGMWLVSRFEGEVAGMPFTGVGTFGYDPRRRSTSAPGSTR